jgi:hypothetical protein
VWHSIKQKKKKNLSHWILAYFDANVVCENRFGWTDHQLVVGGPRFQSDMYEVSSLLSLFLLLSSELSMLLHLNQ